MLFRSSFRCSILSVSIYYEPESDIIVKSYDHFYLSRTSVFIFERLDISWASHIHPSQKLWSFEFVENSRVYYAPESDIRMKCYDHLNFSRASVVHFLASQYIMALTHTPVSKFMAVRICREFTCSISCILTYYEPESDILVKVYAHLNFSRASFVHFRASRYIMDLTHTPE